MLITGYISFAFFNIFLTTQKIIYQKKLTKLNQKAETQFGKGET